MANVAAECGTYRGTPLPGEVGNSGIDGYRDTLFRELKDIRRNDEIQLQTATGLFRYERTNISHQRTLRIVSNFKQNWGKLACIPFTGMGTNSTLLCIHRDPGQLSLLQKNGYELVTASNGHDGLRLFMSRPVDAIVLEYHLGLLDGGSHRG